jgi:trehalose 6-phosphate phosphatase
MTIIDPTLADALARFAAQPWIIVASDFDGTLSPIAPQPDAAYVNPGALDALCALAKLPQTTVAVISGRSLCDLDRMAPFPSTVERIGSHGLEASIGATYGLDARAHLRLNRLTAEIEVLAGATPGSRVEHKPFGIAFHYRHADPARAARALEWIDDTVSRRDGLWMKPGHKVVELLVLPASKSWAVDRLRTAYPDSAVFYAGDDLTDEDIFADLRPGDIGCRVGAGPTAAEFRIADPDAVVAVLEQLAERRAQAFTTEPDLLDGPVAR